MRLCNDRGFKGRKEELQDTLDFYDIIRNNTSEKDYQDKVFDTTAIDYINAFTVPIIRKINTQIYGAPHFPDTITDLEIDGHLNDVRDFLIWENGEIF